jgi:purine-binding chemotaxis protein CheW
MDPTGSDGDDQAKGAAMGLGEALALRRALGDQAVAENVEPEAEYLCVRLHDRSYAIPIGQVAEVLSPTAVTRVPHMPSHVRGVFNRHGKITAVLDLASFSGTESEESPKRMVVLQHGGLEAAVPVSEVIGLVQVRVSKIEPVLAHLAGELAFVTGQINGDEGILSVLDARVLLENSRVRRG